MNQIEVQNLNKHYGEFHALRDVSLSVGKGTFVALVGPSGCGKSTLLRSLAGLEKITSGNILIAGDRMNDLPPRKRDVAMVFQSYALYPHMRVMENLTYSLRLKRMDRKLAEKKARKVAETTGLTELLHRYPRELSGGQRQRVAMARAIVREPRAFLFDEPLSNLDASLRVQMRKEIRAMHDRLGATSIYVTHDQVEAMTMADIVVVMRDGVIEQVGAPLDLYRAPDNKFVAGFLGSPSMNIISSKIVAGSGGSFSVDIPGAKRVAVKTRHKSDVSVGSNVDFGIRPEHLSVGALEDGDSTLSGTIQLLERLGNSTLVHLDTAVGTLVSLAGGETNLSLGDPVGISFDISRAHLFSEDGKVL